MSYLPPRRMIARDSAMYDRYFPVMLGPSRNKTIILFDIQCESRSATRGVSPAPATMAAPDAPRLHPLVQPFSRPRYGTPRLWRTGIPGRRLSHVWRPLPRV